MGKLVAGLAIGIIISITFFVLILRPIVRKCLVKFLELIWR